MLTIPEEHVFSDMLTIPEKHVVYDRLTIPEEHLVSLSFCFLINYDYVDVCRQGTRKVYC
jgi:hypothetical protein